MVNNDVNVSSVPSTTLKWDHDGNQRQIGKDQLQAFREYRGGGLEILSEKAKKHTMLGSQVVLREN